MSTDHEEPRILDLGAALKASVAKAQEKRSEPVRPVRSIQLKLDLQADSWPELFWALEAIAHRCREQEDRGPYEPANVVSGGVGSGFILDIAVDPTKTAERYQQDLKAWVAHRRAASNEVEKVDTAPGGGAS